MTSTPSARSWPGERRRRRSSLRLATVARRPRLGSSLEYCIYAAASQPAREVVDDDGDRAATCSARPGHSARSSTGVDLSQPVDDATFEAIHEAFLEHQVICIRGQSAMTPSDQLAFSARWGEISIHPYVPSIEGYPGLMRIYDPNPVTQTWHSDTTHATQPPAITLLLARTIPPVRRRHHVVQRLRGLRGPLAGPARDARRAAGRAPGHRAGRLRRPRRRGGAHRAPGHPHPSRDGSQRALYVNGNYTTRFDGWTAEDSAPLLDYLYAQVGRPEYVYRHKWQVGDLVIWDNRCTQHAVVGDTGGRRAHAAPRHHRRRRAGLMADPNVSVLVSADDLAAALAGHPARPRRAGRSGRRRRGSAGRGRPARGRFARRPPDVDVRDPAGGGRHQARRRPSPRSPTTARPCTSTAGSASARSPAWRRPGSSPNGLPSMGLRRSPSGRAPISARSAPTPRASPKPGSSACACRTARPSCRRSAGSPRCSRRTRCRTRSRPASEPTIVYDIATTAVAGNKVLLAKKRGDKTIPAGWAADDQGRPTTDTAAASVRHLQWFGGHKGFGLALLVELLAGVLAGSSFGTTERTASPLHGDVRVAKGFVLHRDRPGALHAGWPTSGRASTPSSARSASGERAPGVDRIWLPGEPEHVRSLRARARRHPAAGAAAGRAGPARRRRRRRADRADGVL